MPPRPENKYLTKLKHRRCSNCGAKIAPRQARCQRCDEPQAKPKK